MDGDVHKRLLAAASAAHQQAYMQLRTRLEGNVFLPAIQSRSQPQSERSMRHLQLIEQCIASENRREERLSRCTNERERRVLTKKFFAQRTHERDLVRALMLSYPTNEELEALDVEAARQFYGSPLASTIKGGNGSTGIAFSGNDIGADSEGTSELGNTSPVKPIFRTAVKQPQEGGSVAQFKMMIGPKVSATRVSPVKKPQKKQNTRKDKLQSTTCSASTLSPNRQYKRDLPTTKSQRATATSSSSCANRNPPAVPRSHPSRFPETLTLNFSSLKLTSVRHQGESTRGSSCTKRSLFPSRSDAQLRSLSYRAAPPSCSALPSNQVGRKSDTRSKAFALTLPLQHSPSNEGSNGSTISFGNATSYEEARHQAMRIMQQQQGLVEGSTQTTVRSQDERARWSEGVNSDGAHTNSDLLKQDMVLMMTHKEARSGPRIDAQNDFTRGGVAGPQTSPYRADWSQRIPCQRPHSSPVARKVNPSVLEPTLHSLSKQKQLHSPVEYFQADSLASTGKNGALMTFVSTEDRGRTIQFFPKAVLPEVLREQLTADSRRRDQNSVQERKADVVDALRELPARAQSSVQEMEVDVVDALPEPQARTKSAGAVKMTQHHVEHQPNECPAQKDQTMELKTESLTDGCTQTEVVLVATNAQQTEDVYSLEQDSSKKDKAVNEFLEEVVSAVEELVELVVVAAEEEPEPHDSVEHGTDVDRESSPAASFIQTERASVMQVAQCVTIIQSAFRGHRTRQLFRHALYDEARQCGVLGAMPGTQQGQSGWYQDPNSLLAYFFVVEANGDWLQHVALPCDSLVVTMYQMHRQVYNRMQEQCHQATHEPMLPAIALHG